MQYRKKLAEARSDLKRRDGVIRDLRAEVAAASAAKDKTKILFDEMIAKVRNGVQYEMQLEQQSLQSKAEIAQLRSQLSQSRATAQELRI